MRREAALRVGWVLLAVSSIGLLAAPLTILRHGPDLSVRAGRHVFAGALGLVGLALLEFVLAVVPIRRGEGWAVAAAAVPFIVVGLPVLAVDATHVRQDHLWNTLAPQVTGLALGLTGLALCAWVTRRH